jgi:hypothetical protein
MIMIGILIATVITIVLLLAVGMYIKRGDDDYPQAWF